jgi:hypothetical protein
MTEELAQKKLTVTRALIVLVGLIVLLQLSFWADEKSIEVEGPSRIVKGPQDTLYIQIDRKIAKVSPDGEVLHVLDLDADAAIPEHIADFFVEDDGHLLIARRDSQLLQYYSPEGKLIKTHERVPSALAEGNHYCKFTKDAGSGTLYFADTSHHRIQIYGPDEKERKTISVPSGASATVEHREALDAAMRASPDTPLHYPNGMTFDRDRLLATDTGNDRIIVFYPDGTVEKIIPVMQDESSTLNNVFRLTRAGGAIYAIMRGPNFLGGRVAAYDETTGQERYFLRGSAQTDPWDVFARLDDVLVADRETLSVLRYTPEGKLLDTFGKPSLQSLYADRQVARKTYQWLRIGSLVGMLIVLFWLLFASWRQRIAHDQAGDSLHKPVSGLQSFLGPVGCMRRNALLFMVPGLGQFAAGRILRGVTLLMIMLCFLTLVAYSWFQYFFNRDTSLPVFITIVLMAYTVWIAVILDGVRLSGRPPFASHRFSFKRVLVTVAVPLVTVFAAITSQLVRETIVRNNPALSLGLQAVMRVLTITFSHDATPFSATLSTSVVFGWGGAAAGMFGAMAWQARAGRSKVLIGITAGFLSGIVSWVITVLLVGNRLGALFYVPPVQGALLGSFVYLFFRNNGMPLLVIPVAIAGAWLGNFLKTFAGVVDKTLVNLLLAHGDSAWIGTVTRLELIVFVAFFIHLSIGVAWNAAATGFVGSVETAES